MSSQPKDQFAQSVDSERMLLGSLLGDPQLIETVARKIKPQDFYNLIHGKIYAAMLDTLSADEVIDDIGLKNRVNDQAVTFSYLIELRNFAGFGLLNFDQDVKRIIEKSRAREVQRVIGAAAEMSDSSADELLGFLQSRIDLLKQSAEPTKRRQTMSELVDDQAERYRLWFKGISNAIPTGFPAIDKHLLGGGLVRSGLYILAARPSMGKTSLSLDITANISRENKRAYFVTREMTNASLFDRLHSANAQVARWKLRSGIYKSDYDRLIETLPAMGTMPITLDNESRSVRDVKNVMRELQRMGLLPDFLVVDYVQQMEGVKGRSRNEEVGSVTRHLKSLALEFDIAVLALSQLSRDLVKHGREPELSDLRDSGEIEQDADAVFMLFGDYPEEGAKFYSRQFKCAKQRDGALFREEMLFNGELVTFRPPEQLILQGGYQ